MDETRVVNVPVVMNDDEYRKYQKFQAEKKNDSQIVEKDIPKAEIRGSVSKKKRSKFMELFIKEDISNVKEYLFKDVLVPSIINLFRDSVNNALDMMFYGEPRRDRRQRGRASNISYNRYYDEDRDYRRDRDRDREKDRRHYDYEDIEFKYRDDAIDIMKKADDIMDRYGVMSINDYYSIMPDEILEDLNIHPVFTDEKYGWTDIRSMHEERTFGGKWKIKMPRAVPLN